MGVSSILYLLVAIVITQQLAIAQVQINQTKGNECRHVSILSRASLSDTRSTLCYVPWKPASRQTITLRKALDPEARWTLERIRGLNGQLMYVGPGAVYFLSQKACLDAGNATSLPIRPMYGNISRGALPVGRIGDFNYRSQGDIFKSCVENDTPWSAFTFKGRISDEPKPVPLNAKLYMKSHLGRHEGQGLKLVPFEFSYTEEDLERMFRLALAQAASKDPSMLPSEEPQIRLGEPAVVYGYPFETGHTIITSASNIAGKNHTELNLDITVLAWNRLQEAVASHTGRPAPPVLLPEAITDADLLGITVLAVISVITFRHALFSAADARRERVVRWKRQGQSAYWTCVKTAADHKGLSRYPAPMQQQDLSAAFASFIVAAVAIVGAILHFRASDVRYRNFLVVRQGGVVTTGPSQSAKWAIDESNQYAGAVFVVGTWLMAQTVEVGYVAIFEVIVVLYCLSATALLLYLYRFATLREHQLDKAIFHGPVQFLRAVPQALIGGIVSYCPGANRVLRSYRSTYKQTVSDFAEQYDVPEFSPTVDFTKLWDGELKLPPRWHNGKEDVHLTEDDIEKAAAFLTADKYGRLRYPQVLALLSSEQLMKAADDFQRFRTSIPQPEEIRSFARLFYCKGILLPEKSENGISGVQFRAVQGDGDLKHNHERVAVLLAPDGENTPLREQMFAIMDSVV